MSTRQSYQYDIVDAIRENLGRRSIIYRPSDNPTAAPDVRYSDLGIIDHGVADRLSSMGTPIVFPITFKGGRYKRYDKDGRVQEITMGDFTLPPTCVATFRRAKIKRKTRVVAGRASIKEQYGHDDWEIVIEGWLLDDDDQPQGLREFSDQEARLLEWETLADSIQVEGEVFAAKGIYRMDIDEIEIRPVRGRERWVAFRITCESDDPTELILQ